jgi:hypothetical protein
MNASGRIEITTESSKNLGKLTFVGAIGVPVMHAAESAIVQALPQLSPGFTLVTDLSQLNTMDRGCVPVIAKFMDIFADAGVAKIVRIIPSSAKDIGFNIMSLFHYRKGVKVITCQTADEAARAYH